MAERDDNNRESRPDLMMLGIVRITQVCKTIRTIVISAFVVTSVYIIIDAIVELQKPPWRLALIVVCSTILLPMMHNMILWFRVRRFTRTTAHRNTELERQADPRRNGTGLDQNGGTPKDDP